MWVVCVCVGNGYVGGRCVGGGWWVCLLACLSVNSLVPS